MADIAPEDAWAKVRENNDPLNYLLLTTGAGNKPVIASMGNTGRKGLVAELDPAKVMFGAFRVHAIDERGTVTSTRAKFVQVSWIGQSVSPMQRGKVSMVRDQFKKILQGCHIDIQTSDEGDVDEDLVVAKLQATTGAHKPSRYDFEALPDGEVAPASPTSKSPAAEGGSTTSGAPPPPVGAPPPPPPPPPPADGASKAAPSTDALFAEINQKGDGITGGLKKVTDDMKTHKQQREEGYSLIKEEAAPKKAAVKKGAQPKGDPVKECKGGKRWHIEHQWGDKNEWKEFTLDETTKDQAVYIYECQFTFIKITQKINSITLVNCKRVNVQFQDLIAGLEITNCQNCNTEVKGSYPSANVEKSSDINLYLSKDSLSTELTACTSTGVNITLPGESENDDPKELAVPDQFITKIVNRKLVTTCVDHV